MPVDEHREITIGEGRLRAGDRINRDARLRDDFLAIRAGDLVMLVEPFGCQTLRRPARCRWADLVLWLQVDALRLKRAVIDPCIDIQFGQTRVDVLAPTLAPFLQQVGAVPVAVLLAEPVLADLAHRQHDMRVRLRHAVGTDIPMHVQIGDHAAVDKLVAHEVAGERDALFLGHFSGNRELDLAGELRVDPLLGRFDLVPQLFAVGQMLRRALGQQHFGVNDAGLVREVVMAVEPLVVQPRSRTIGSGSNRARS
ncbi:hypothetical protein D9M73_104240 [compost metagenome]